MSLPPPPITDADAAYPETEGFDDFVRENQAHLEKLEALRSDSETQEHMQQHVQLLEGSGHTQRWFMLRGCESEALLKPGTPEHEELRAAARQLFLLDAACDAANHHFRAVCAQSNPGSRSCKDKNDPLLTACLNTCRISMCVQKHGDSFVTDAADLQLSAKEGIKMLFRALGLTNDPMKVRQKLTEKVDNHVHLLKKRVVKQRVEKEKEERRKVEQRAAEAEARAMTEKRQKGSQFKGVFAMVLLLAIAAAWVQSMGGFQ